MNPNADRPVQAHQNRLAREKSPYLLQHASNPVDWYPWGEEAFERARREDKPIFLSIGYSTCHWCHVMERESFEDPEVARLLNAAFVCIKVDREERPDIDSIYMTVCQMMTGSGGWPLTILMTPDKKPFFAATYIPKTARFGQVGLMDLIPQVAELWKQRRADVLDSANKIASALGQTTERERGAELGEDALRRAYAQLAARFDTDHGGFGTAPKFPTPHNLSFLLRFGRRIGIDRATEMVERTLQAMRRGGIYDHVGFGFHRYSTDAEWLVPHFEKMLYDQALLAIAYTEAWQATGKPEYEQTAREILTYVLRDMTSPEGGFYSAEDADSEGEEGKFYVWTLEEVREVLGPDDASLAIQIFGIAPEGNWIDQATRHRSGTNILHLAKPLSELAADHPLPRNAGMGGRGSGRAAPNDPSTAQRELRPPAAPHAGAEPAPAEVELRRRIESIRQRLFAVREQRVHPHKDDKILTDWNGLMIAALALAGRAFDEPRYAEAAQRAADFLLKTLRRPDGRLLHRFRADRTPLVPPLRGGMPGLGRSGIPSLSSPRSGGGMPGLGRSGVPSSLPSEPGAGERSDTAGQASRGTGIDTGEAGILAFADDHAFLIWGLLELYETTFDVRDLQAAVDLNRDLLAHFWDDRAGAFFSTADDAEGLLIRQKEIYDGAVPSPNSVAMLDLLRLARMTGSPVATSGPLVGPSSGLGVATSGPLVAHASGSPVATSGSLVGLDSVGAALEEKAARIARAFAGEVAQTPMAYTQLMIALDFALGHSREVVIVGQPQAADTRAMLRALRTRFLPDTVVLFRPSGEPDPAIARLAPFTRDQTGLDGAATAYVCRDHACKAPTTDAAQMLELLGSDGAKAAPK